MSKRKEVGNRYFWLTILIVVATVPVHIAIRYYFWDFSAETFNNIITPIATVISGILVYLALRQTGKQNNIVLAQALSEIFSNRLKNLEAQLRESRVDGVLMAVGVLVNRPDDLYNNIRINSIDFADRIAEALDRIRANDEYQNDLDAFLSKMGNDYKAPRLEVRSYYRDLRFVMAFNTFPIARLDVIEVFISDLNEASLLVQSQSYFKSEIRHRFVKPFMRLMQNDALLLLPDPFSSGEVKWYFYNEGPLKVYYDLFRKELR